MTSKLKALMFQGAVFLALGSLVKAAAVPQIRTQPGYFRMMLGDFEVTALHDGEIVLPIDDVMPTVAKEDFKRAFQRDFIPVPAVASINTFLVNTNEHLVLIDTGAGKLFGKSGGLLHKSIRAAGYQAEQIDLLLVTHLHIDHHGGLSPEGTMAFPNATMRISQAEADYWLQPENKANSSDEHMRKNFDQAAAAVGPYQAAGKFKPFGPSEADSLVKGIRGLTRFGHTPGHTVYFVESRGQTLVAWGDIMHFQAIQMPDPAVTIKYDHNQDEARKSRKDLLRLVHEKKYLVAGAHIDFPGIGHVRSGLQEGSFEWVPARYEADIQRNKTADFSIAG